MTEAARDYANARLRSVLRVAIATCLMSTGLVPCMAQAQSDLRYAYPQQISLSPLGVNLQTGRFTHLVTDISIGDLQLTRSWGDVATYKGMRRMFGTRVENQGYVTGWAHNFSQGVHFDATTNNMYQVTIGGAAYRFASGTNGFTPWNRTARGSSLIKTGAVYDLTTSSGEQHRFDVVSGNDARIAWTVRSDGTRIDYSYNASGQLHQIRSSRGYAIVIDYGSQGNISSACGFNLAETFVPATHSCAGAALKTGYTYSADGNNLLTITDVSNAVVTITGYATMGGPLCITQPNSPICAITNSYDKLPGEDVLYNPPPDAVRTQTTPAGGIWTYTYELGENVNDVPIQPGRPRWTGTMMADPDGRNTITRYDRGVLVDVDAPAGFTNYKYENLNIQNANINFDYHAVQPTLITTPSGNQEYYLFNGRGEVILRSLWPQGAPEPTLTNGSNMLAPLSDPDLRTCCTVPGIANIPAGAVSFGQAYLPDYPAGHPYPSGCGTGPAQFRLCNKPLARIDANGNQTDYTYDPAHGGVLTETLPADATGVRPQTRFTYVQRTAWLRTSGGGYAASPYPVWLLASRSSCKTTAASGNGCAGGPSDEVVTLYEYGMDSGPNNLLLRGMVEDATGAALRTCYAYDGRGNRISETRPGGTGGLSVCP